MPRTLTTKNSVYALVNLFDRFLHGEIQDLYITLHNGRNCYIEISKKVFGNTQTDIMYYIIFKFPFENMFPPEIKNRFDYVTGRDIPTEDWYTSPHDIAFIVQTSDDFTFIIEKLKNYNITEISAYNNRNMYDYTVDDIIMLNVAPMLRNEANWAKKRLREREEGDPERERKRMMDDPDFFNFGKKKRSDALQQVNSEIKYLR